MKKMLFSTVLSACLFMSLMTPAFAGVDASILSNQIGNELEAEFTVTAADVEDTVVISWDNEVLDLDLASFDLTKDVRRSINYYVSPGEDNDDDVTVSILLKMPQASADALKTVRDSDNDSVEALFTDSGFVYYLMAAGITIETGADPRAFTFDIVFDAVTAEGTPFSASLIAVEEALKTPPTIDFTDFVEDEGQIVWLMVTPNGGDGGWQDALTQISYSMNGVDYVNVNPADYTIEEGSFKFSGDAVSGLQIFGDPVTFKFEAEGFEDTTIQISFDF